MEDSFKINALWFIPDKPEKKYRGELRFERGELIELNFHELLNDFKGNDFIIHGDSNTSFITLLDCKSIFFDDYTIIHPKFIFIGDNYLTENDFKFDKVETSLNTFNEWIDVSGFNIKRNIGGFDVQYRTPSHIDFEINDKIHGHIHFFNNYPSEKISKDVTLSQRAKLHLKANDKNEGVHFISFLQYINMFQNFIELGTFKIAYPKQITFVNGERDAEVEYKFYTVFNIKNHSVPKSKFDFLFRYKQIEKEFNSIIQKWFSNYEKISPVIYLFVDSIYDRYEFNENKFLNIIQAIESFHRRTRNNERLPKSEYNKMIKAIRESVPEEYKEYVTQRVHGNEPSLHERLEALLNELETPTLKKIIGDRDKFIKDSKNSRNYYTHYDLKLEAKALKEVELYNLYEKVKILMYVALLLETGFTKELVEKILNSPSVRFFSFDLPID